jgi:hypothetical protein
MRPMQLDGHYAAAQLWKLDTFNGYDIPLYAVLGEYLMLPQFPSARFKAWIEQYDRLPDVSGRVSFYVLPDEEFPQHLSERATVTCNVLDIIDGVQTWIEYHGSVAQYLSQRWEIWDAFLPTCVKITDVLTDEEQAYFDEWRNHYARSPWPLVGMRGAHHQLRGLYDRHRAHLRAWLAAQPALPYNGDYVVVRYFNGEVYSRTTHRWGIEAPGPDF